MTCTATHARLLSQARRAGGKIHFRYRQALNGFAATLPARALDQLRRRPDVAYVQVDQRVWLVDEYDTPAARIGSYASQTSPPWGLDRIDQRDLPLDSQYTYTQIGAGVNVYVVDTGIRTTHGEFVGRAPAGFDAVLDGYGATDCHGHGTHVAGTLGGSTYGVAKAVNLYAVRVLDCSGSGSTSGVIAGIDWLTANFTSPALANLSLGGGASTALDEAVRNSINVGKGVGREDKIIIRLPSPTSMEMQSLKLSRQLVLRRPEFTCMSFVGMGAPRPVFLYSFQTMGWWTLIRSSAMWMGMDSAR